MCNPILKGDILKSKNEGKEKWRKICAVTNSSKLDESETSSENKVSYLRCYH